MLTQVREVKITKRTSKTLKTKKDQGQGRQKHVIFQQKFHHPVNSNSEIFISDHESFSSSYDKPNQIRDITENADSVYSQQLMMDKDNQINQAQKQNKMKLIRYTFKKDKEMKKKGIKIEQKHFLKKKINDYQTIYQRKDPSFISFPDISLEKQQTCQRIDIINNQDLFRMASQENNTTI